MNLRTASRLSVITLVLVVVTIFYVTHGTLASPRSTSLPGTSLGGTAAPDFELLDQHGASLSLAQLRGAPVLLTFMAPQCATSCQQMAARVHTALSQLGAAGQRVTVLVVSLDPTGDTPAAAAFAQRLQMTARWHYLTGSCAALSAVWKAYGVAGAGCGSGASAAQAQALGLYVLDARGSERFYLDSSLAAASLAEDLSSVSIG
jgi:protein SCO1